MNERRLWKQSSRNASSEPLRIRCGVQGDSPHTGLSQLLNNILGEVVVHKAAYRLVPSGQWCCVDIQLRLSMQPPLDWWPWHGRVHQHI
jgi:hypothetical protein